MKAPAAAFFLALLTAASIGPAPARADASPPGFTALFNGKNLAGWWGLSTEDPRKWMALPSAELKKKHDASLKDIAQHWRVENGELINDGHGLYLTTEKNFRDFELLIDYKTVAKADSGIYLKGTPQVQIWDSTKEGGKWDRGAGKGSGGLWNNRPGSPGKDPLVLADKPFGQWNHFRIVQCGSRTRVRLNEKQVVDGAILENYFDKARQTPIVPAGPIQLQTHGGEIRWRNVFLREIPADEANRLLRGADPKGFKPIFNGKNFDGWAGPTDNYEVVDGAIRCKPKKGGTIFTKEQFANFVARLEFKLPPGGNNGLAIRYPGTGGASHGAMCELQVLDDNYEKVRSKIDPRQAHGSAYGMVPAARGYQRPIGQWNYQEVTVNGPTIKVELNGTVILDCDLSKVKETMGNNPYPGKDRTSGSFGFAGHSDPVMFRNVSIRRLPSTVPTGAAAPAGRSPVTLVDFAKPLSEIAAIPADAMVSQENGRLRVHTRHKAERPGVTLKGPGGRWNLTGFTELETTVKNLGKWPLTVHAAVESPDSNRTARQNCCVESVNIPPGQEAALKVKLRARVPEPLAGKLRGMRGCPGGFQDGSRATIDPTNVVGISVYLYRPSADQVFEMSSFRAGGTPVFPLPENVAELFPIIDRFGQYVHKDWPGKIHSEDELAKQREREEADLAAHPGPQGWNQYGGWLGGPKLEATGRFRVEKWRGKWWFVDPEGRLYWSHGLVRVTWSCGYTPVTGREHLFAELPDRGSPLAPFFGRSTWPIAGQYERGTRTYNFSGANLLRKYGPGWPEEFAEVAHRRLRSWGLNTLANCSQPAIYLKRKTPYTATVYSLDSPPADTPGATGYVATIHNGGRVIEGTSGGWGKFPDVFDPSFKATLLREVAQHKGKAVGDPWCVGYFPGNELSWGKDETSLARAVLASPESQPAKRALVDGLKAKYGKIEQLNAAWKTVYASWDALLASTTPPGDDAGRDDLAAFLGHLADAYFRQCREAVKEIDPGGLYLGCRFAGGSHAVVFRTAAKYSDVISVNRYTETLADLRLPDGIDKPVLIGEFHFGALDRGKFHASLREVASQEARGAAYEKYVQSALENPLVVGTHWHQLSDQATTGRDDGENFQNGFTDVCDTPYVETVGACRRIGYRLYEIRAKSLSACDATHTSRVRSLTSGRCLASPWRGG